jgi:hypothetical protein
LKTWSAKYDVVTEEETLQAAVIGVGTVIIETLSVDPKYSKRSSGVVVVMVGAIILLPELTLPLLASIGFVELTPERSAIPPDALWTL